MQNVRLSHNPYKLETEILVNGEPPKQDSCLVQFRKQRFQVWVDQLPELLAREYNDDEFEITFHGTELDYQDLMASVNAASDLEIRVSKEPAKEFQEKETDIRNLFSQVQMLPFEELHSPALVDAFNKAFNEEFEVNVVATMSAGKSTLINALLGKKLMPSKQGACTATITKIKDDDDGTFKAEAFDSEQNKISYLSNLTYKEMSGLNKNPDVSEVVVSGNIPFVTTEEASLVLIDTPGPNNARDKRHGLVTAKALDQSSKMLVMFIMNGGTLHDDAQDAFLRRVAKSMSVGGKQSRERFLFVINKMDAYEEEDDDIANETLPETKRYLEEMGIKNPNIFPAAAEPALLIRRYKNTFDEAEKAKLKRKLEPLVDKIISQEQLHLERYTEYHNLPQSSEDKIAGELEKAQKVGNRLEEALIHTGIKDIEEMIRMYVTKYCRPAKITNVVNSFIHELDSAEAFERTKQTIVSKSNQIEETRLKIEELEEKLESSKEQAIFKEKIQNLDIRTSLGRELNSLIGDVEADITEFLDGAEEEMDELEATQFLNRFNRKAIEKQQEFQNSVDLLLKRDIKEKGDQLLDQYIEKLAALSKEFSTEGISINLHDFVKGQLALIDPEKALDQSIDSKQEVHQEIRTRSVCHTRAWYNPMRWIDGKYYYEDEDYTVNVTEEVKFISREKLINVLMPPIRKSLQEERKNIEQFAEEASNRLKAQFQQKFKEVDEILQNKAKELKQALTSQVDSENALKQANELLAQLEGIKKELEAILEI